MSLTNTRVDRLIIRSWFYHEVKPPFLTVVETAHPWFQGLEQATQYKANELAGPLWGLKLKT